MTRFLSGSEQVATSNSGASVTLRATNHYGSLGLVIL